MEVNVYEKSILELHCDTLIVAVKKCSTQYIGFYTIDQAFDGYLKKTIAEDKSYGEFGRVNLLHTFGKIPAKYIVLVGLGTIEQLTNDKLRQLAAISSRSAKTVHTKSLAVMMPENILNNEQARAVVEGVILGTYCFKEYKTEKPPTQPIKELLLVAPKTIVKKQQLQEAQIIAQNVNLARDLVNHPACYLTPAKMAELAQEIADQYSLEAIILDTDEMKTLEMNALLSVAQGSTQPPKMIVLKYTGKPDSIESLAFVGKGITFDSGGISLKPSQKMDEMKDDMAGAAAALAAVKTIAELKLPINVLAVMPCTENMPSGSALKPGDVISSMSKKTIEIISTDAEGRLILADGVTYAQRLGATKIIDLATLTGACLVALGDIACGIVANNDEFTKAFLSASNKTGEKAWELPHYEEYTELIKSDIADMKNSGGRLAGTITAGLFIKNFVDNIPWVHVDIAGTADIAKTSGYNLKGATGAGVRTLVRLAQDLAYDE